MLIFSNLPKSAEQTGDTTKKNKLKNCRKNFKAALDKCKTSSSLRVLKEAVSRDFLPLFFSRIETIWAPDKQAKTVLLKNFVFVKIFAFKV